MPAGRAGISLPKAAFHGLDTPQLRFIGTMAPLPYSAYADSR